MDNVKEDANFSLSISPLGHVYLSAETDDEGKIDLTTLNKLKPFFAEDPNVGLLYLGILGLGSLPPTFAYWQKFSHQLISKACRMASSTDNNKFHLSAPAEQELEDYIKTAPFMKGIEYLQQTILIELWEKLVECLFNEIDKTQDNLQDFLQRHNPSWNLLGRVCFHLGEHKENESTPFVFLATYTSSISADTKIQHLPLKRALQEYTGEQNKTTLLSLLLPIQRAANHSPFIKSMIDNGDIYNSQRWSAKEAYKFLKDIPALEAAGIMVRVPNWWSSSKPPRPKVIVTIGKDKVSSIGVDGLMDFDLHMALENGSQLTEEELRQLLSNSEDKLIKVKGQWIEVDRDKLQDVLTHWKSIQSRIKNEGLSFTAGMRLLAGASSLDDNSSGLTSINDTAQWSNVVAGDWLRDTLHNLHSPENIVNDTIALTLKEHLLSTTLRPYQLNGLKWLWMLYQLRLGGCLADDMGLGKTIQVISLLLLIRWQSANATSLLVVPASLIGNWQAELSKFAPSLKVWIAHPSIASKTELQLHSPEHFQQFDLVITTYAMVTRLDWLCESKWTIVVLDEAQLIKNPDSKQTRAIKKLNAQVKFALTGTPVENRMSDLWSLFDFTSPGLLGSMKNFQSYHKKLEKQDEGSSGTSRFIASIRALTGPYILRRLKSDKRIIQDLPDKVELAAFCGLSKQQVLLYQQAVESLYNILRNDDSDGIKRKGIILAYMTRFKQICNHPTQWLGYGDYNIADSGKFQRLKELGESIAAKQEKVLVFTQFREIIPAISSCLADVFGREGLILHGATAIKERANLVESFQKEQGPPFFVLSLKAGGTGLNLTNASHVIHFDRWWNPAVENQATDRAYRIGQKKSVLVHKFICRGSIEEKIDALIKQKKSLSEEVLGGDNELNLSNMKTDDLMKIVSLDIHQAFSEY